MNDRYSFSDENPNNPTFPVPANFHWKIWMGPEVEGCNNIGDNTLFVRQGLHFPYYLGLHRYIKRVWFCKEFLDTISKPLGVALLTELKVACPDVDFAFEIPVADIDMYVHLRKLGAFYVKIDLGGYIQPGDTLCIGKPYNDRFVLFAESSKVDVNSYEQDICLEGGFVYTQK